jgi:uncharacterized protein YndB with AHSA1/START domain
MKTTAVNVGIDVKVDPETAFSIFTDEISLWWRRGTRYWADAERGKTVRFEPGIGGRLLEVYDLDTGDGLEHGKITAWEPGNLLRFTWHQSDWPDGVDTEVEVSFIPTAEGTRVELSHGGWELVPTAGVEEAYQQGWVDLLGFYSEHVEHERSST